MGISLQWIENPGAPHRHGATTEYVFPKEAEGCLDGGILAKLGLNEKRMGTKTGDTDALFFCPLILPTRNHQFSGTNDDSIISHCHQVEGHTNGSKRHSGMGGSRGRS